MSRTSNIYARVEPEVKEQAEQILDRLGIPMSNAISIFLRQVIIQRGIPFDMKLPKSNILSYSSLSESGFDKEMEKGYDDMLSGNVMSAQQVAERMSAQYGV